MIDLNSIANGPNEANCAMCRGRGFYGSPGARCTFCDGTGRVKWRSRPVDDQPLTTTPVVGQKPANVTDNPVLVPRKLAMRILGLLAQECAPCADPQCQITSNPEQAITECRDQLWELLIEGRSTAPGVTVDRHQTFCTEKSKP